MVQVPKKYQPFIETVEKDADGYWAYTVRGYMFAGMGCHTAHEYSKAELLRMIRTVEPCECFNCTGK